MWGDVQVKVQRMGAVCRDEKAMLITETEAVTREKQVVWTVKSDEDVLTFPATDDVRLQKGEVQQIRKP